MAEITQVKWLGENIHEDSAHRLVTDKQIARWNINPDYNQNDETQPDHIKNRPFYAGEYVLVNETITTGSLNDSNDVSIYNIPISSLLGKSIILGEKYIINVDGTEYPFTPWISMGPSSDTYISKTDPTVMASYSLFRSNDISPIDFVISINYLGNFPLTKRSDQMGYEYIFDNDMVDYVCILLPETIPTAHNIKIYKEEYHRLDEKYIPETIVRKSYIELTNNNYLDYTKITDNDGDHINIRNMPDGEYHIAFSELMATDSPLIELLNFSETDSLYGNISRTLKNRLLDSNSFNNLKNSAIINIKTTEMVEYIESNNTIIRTQKNIKNITLDIYINNILCDYSFTNCRDDNNIKKYGRNIIMKYSTMCNSGIYDEDDYINFDLDTIEGDVDRYPDIIEISSIYGIELDRVVNPGTYRMVDYNWDKDTSSIPFIPRESTLTVTTTKSGVCIQRVFDTLNFCEYIRFNLDINADLVCNEWTDWARIGYSVPFPLI